MALQDLKNELTSLQNIAADQRTPEQKARITTLFEMVSPYGTNYQEDQRFTNINGTDYWTQDSRQVDVSNNYGEKAGTFFDMVDNDRPETHNQKVVVNGEMQGYAPTGTNPATYQNITSQIQRPPDATSTPMQSPEATSSMTRGGSQTAGTAQPAGDDLTAQLRANGFGSSTPSGEPPAPTTPPQPNAGSGGPLQLYGKSVADQTKTLGEFLRSNGYNIDFVVGGTSPYDAEINAAIDRINQNTDPNLLPHLIDQLATSVQKRTNSVQGATMKWNAATGQILAPGARTTQDLIAGLNPGSQPGATGNTGSSPNPQGGAGGATGATPSNNPQGVVPIVNPGLYNGLLERLASGGITPEQQGQQESQLVSDVERSAARRRQMLADSLASSGVFGGRGADILSDAGSEADYARATGLSSLRSNIMQQQNQARTQALEAMLRQIGFAAQEAQSIANLMTNRAIAQAQLATGADQFQQTMGLNGLQMAQREAEQQWNMIVTLLQLENQVSESDRVAIRALLDDILAGGTA